MIVVIGGDRATGKSTSLSNIKPPLVKEEIVGLNPEKTYYLNIAGKDLATKAMAKGYVEGKNYKATHNYAIISKIIKGIAGGTRFNKLVIDDFQYTMSLDFFDRRQEKGFDKFGQIGFSVINLITYLMQVRKDLVVFILAHTDEVDENGNKKVKLKTIGKMLDEKFKLEGMFTWIIESNAIWDDMAEEMKYEFSVKPTSRGSVARSPIDAFLDEEGKPLKRIRPDAGLIEIEIRKYIN